LLIPDKWVAYFVILSITFGCAVLVNIGIFIYKLKNPNIIVKKPIKIIKLTKEEQIKDDKNCLVVLLIGIVITIVVIGLDIIRRPDIWISFWKVITK
jgi:hypothetical protein